jgi:DNA polymerase I-like protein with 3'-5' exonuclease and polymerase domains
MSNISFISDRTLPHISYPTYSLEQVDFPLNSGLDLETTGLKFNKDNILMVLLGDDEHQFVIDYNFVDKNLLREKLGQVNLFVGHNLSFDLPFLIHHLDLKFPINSIYDTMETELTLVKGTKKSVSLFNTVKRRLNIELTDKGITKEFTFMDRRNPHFEDRHIFYGAQDIKYLFDIKRAQSVFIDKFGNEELVNYNNNTVIVSAMMKVRGVKVDKEKWMKLYYNNLAKTDELAVVMDDQLAEGGLLQRNKRVRERTEQLDMFGGPSIDIVNKNIDNINFDSPQQIVQIFVQLNQPIPKSAKEDKNSIGKATLQQYIIERPSSPLKPFIETLIEYKDYSKRAKAFGKKWFVENVDSDGAVRASFIINRTTTGRFSCQSPNLQQMPSSQSYRDCFVARDNYKIWGADYSGAELKILASLSKDEVMLDLLGKGADLHGHAATVALRYLTKDKNVIVDKNNNKEFRTKMKNVIFGLVYGAGVSKIAELLDISKSRAEKVYELLKETFPQAFSYLETVAQFGLDNGYVVFDGKWKQRRWFPEFFENSYLTSSQKSAIERYCKNSPIQGLNGQMMKMALVNIYDYIYKNNVDAHILITVHDEVLIEVNENELSHCQNFKQIMLDSGDYFLDGIKMEVEDYIDNCWIK